MFDILSVCLSVCLIRNCVCLPASRNYVELLKNLKRDSELPYQLCNKVGHLVPDESDTVRSRPLELDHSLPNAL